MAAPRARPPRRRGGGSSNSVNITSRLVMALIAFLSIFYLYLSHVEVTRHDISRSSPHPFPGQSFDTDGNYDDEDPRQHEPEVLRQPNHPAEGPMDYIPLQCDGGKPDVDLSYWKDIPLDKAYESPWGASARKAQEEGRPQYVTFEPDHGGFNNIRMAMEVMLVFARATGRTLVMPLAQKFYLLNRPAVEFADMFPIEYLSDYMDVITMEEFLKKEGLTGRLGKAPPGNKSSGHSKEAVQDYLREVADIVPHWYHMDEALIFGPSPEDPKVPNDEESQAISAWLQEFLTDKRRQLDYGEDMQRARHIHFRTSPGKGREEYRLFTHFYTFVGFSDPVAARHHRRLVRDLVHFRESLFCAAATIVGRLRAAGGGDPGNWSGYYGEWGGLGGKEGGVGGGEVAGVGGGSYADDGGGEVRKRAGFSTFHIRRGDFQYARMKPPAETIAAATKDLIQPGEVLFIATDERKKEFFDVFTYEHRVFYLDDFQDVLDGIDPSYYLMIDTIVASQGRTFIGTWRSTFTGYITRLRGYYRFPTEFSWYFWDESAKDYIPKSLVEDAVPRSPFFMREWPVAWEDLDQDVWP
ncbi:unnamed protein product [Ectocarpus sp. CCAP 1310/34]|nr:unnamed protein product [Ectocarpus sp. CCAP 1310/34]